MKDKLKKNGRRPQFVLKNYKEDLKKTSKMEYDLKKMKMEEDPLFLKFKDYLKIEDDLIYI